MKISIDTQVEVDTDDFSKEEWIAFILNYLEVRDISKVGLYDLFPLDTLKIKASHAYMASQRNLEILQPTEGD